MYFMHRIRKTSGNYDKGIEVQETLDAAKQSYHAQLGAYAYGHDPNTDYVQVAITNDDGAVLLNETWKAAPVAAE